MHSYYRQAEIALNIGLKQDPTRWYHQFREQIFPYIKERLCEEFSPHILCAEELIILQEYDRENQTEYFHTLRVYLEQNRNAVSSAKILFIHRATMMYRLKRIRELASINFDDPKQMLYLQISYYFLIEEKDDSI